MILARVQPDDEEVTAPAGDDAAPSSAAPSREEMLRRKAHLEAALFVRFVRKQKRFAEAQVNFAVKTDTRLLEYRNGRSLRRSC